MAMRPAPADNNITRCVIEIKRKRVELGLLASFFRMFGTARTGTEENNPS